MKIFDNDNPALKRAIEKKKRRKGWIQLAVIIVVFALLLIYNALRTPAAHITVNVTALAGAGRIVPNGIPIQINGDGQSLYNGMLVNGAAHTKQNYYGLYDISFSLSSSLWSVQAPEQTINVNIFHFKSNNKISNTVNIILMISPDTGEITLQGFVQNDDGVTYQCAASAPLTDGETIELHARTDSP